MREILFRGKRIDNGEWVVSDCYYKCDYTIKLWAKRDGWTKVLTDTVGQFIGVTDKDGKKIFEGDIVKHYNIEEMPECFYTFVVEHDATNCRFMNCPIGKNECYNIGRCCTYEVIGNIYDNPELLKEQ